MFPVKVTAVVLVFAHKVSSTGSITVGIGLTVNAPEKSDVSHTLPFAETTQ